MNGFVSLFFSGLAGPDSQGLGLIFDLSRPDLSLCVQVWTFYFSRTPKLQIGKGLEQGRQPSTSIEKPQKNFAKDKTPHFSRWVWCAQVWPAVRPARFRLLHSFQHPRKQGAWCVAHSTLD